jgi:hypothetical protein
MRNRIVKAEKDLEYHGAKLAELVLRMDVAQSLIDSMCTENSEPPTGTEIDQYEIMLDLRDRAEYEYNRHLAEMEIAQATLKLLRSGKLTDYN